MMGSKLHSSARKLKQSLKTKQSNENSHIPAEFDTRHAWPQCESVAAVADQGEF